MSVYGYVLCAIRYHFDKIRAERGGTRQHVLETRQVVVVHGCQLNRLVFAGIGSTGLTGVAGEDNEHRGDDERERDLVLLDVGAERDGFEAALNYDGATNRQREVEEI